MIRSQPMAPSATPKYACCSTMNAPSSFFTRKRYPTRSRSTTVSCSIDSMASIRSPGSNHLPKTRLDDLGRGCRLPRPTGRQRPEVDRRARGAPASADILCGDCAGERSPTVVSIAPLSTLPVADWQTPHCTLTLRCAPEIGSVVSRNVRHDDAERGGLLLDTTGVGQHELARQLGVPRSRGSRAAR